MKELSSEEELILEKNLIWIFADRRSGTTWLAKELLSSYTKYIDEPLIGLHLGRYVQNKEGPKRTLEIQSNKQDYFFSKEFKKTWKFYLRKLILNRIYNQFNNLTEKIVIKEPSGSIAADILAEILSNSKIIILLRDGRDVLDSKIDAESRGGWEIQEKKGLRSEVTDEKRVSYIKNHSRFWIWLIEILLKTYDNHPENLRILLKYEDLRKNTLCELKKIFQFLAIPISDEKLEKIVTKYAFENVPQKQKGIGKFKRFASPGKWQENFNEKEKIIINDIMGKTLKKLGYSTC